MKTEIYKLHHKQAESNAVHLVLHYVLTTPRRRKEPFSRLLVMSCVAVYSCSNQSRFRVVVGAREILLLHFAFVLQLLALCGLLTYGVKTRPH